MAQSRIEAILENVLGGDNVILEPVSRNEALILQVVEKMDGTPITSDEIDEIINSIS